MKNRILHNPNIQTIRRLLPFLRNEKRRLMIAAILLFGLTVVEIAAPLLVGVAVDTVLGNRNNFGFVSLNFIVGVLFVGAIVRLFLLAQSQKLTGEIGECVSANIRQRLWEHLLRLPIEYAERRGSGKLLLRFTGDARSIQRLVTQGLVRLGQDFLLMVGVAVALAWINWRMALAVLLIFPVFVTIFAILNPKLREKSRRVRGRRSRISGYLHEHIAGVSAVKACVRQETEAEKFASLLRGAVKRGTEFAAIGGWMRGTSAATLAIAGAIILLVAGGEISGGRLTSGSLVAFYALLGLLLPVLQRVENSNRYLQEAAISLQRVDELLSAAPENFFDKPRPILKVETGEIKIQEVSFEYDTNTPIFRQISLHAKRGEIVALVGANGAGKSTLLDLLLGFRQPTAGKILIDGKNIAEIALDSLRANIGLVTQKTTIFSGTILENIIYGANADEPDEDFAKALHLSGVDKFIAEFPKGLETQIGSEGGKLSGGQRQRIALARSLASNPPILVLDEATSALDAETEMALAETLRELAREKTIIVAAHRLPTLRVADRIYVLEQGQIVEQGNHETLLNRNRIYARIFADEKNVNQRLEKIAA